MVNQHMTILYIPESTTSNPRAASFSLGVKILQETMRSLTVIRTDNDWARMQGGKQPSNPMLAGFPLAQFLFLNTVFKPKGSQKVIPLALRIDVMDAGADDDHLGIMLDVRHSERWTDEGIDAVEDRIRTFLASAQTPIHHEYLLTHAPLQAGLDLNDPWKAYFFNMWEHAKADYVASHGGDMELIDVDLKRNNHGGTDVVLKIRTSGSCGGCAGATFTVNKKIWPNLKPLIDQANTENEGVEGYPLVVKNIIPITPTEALFMKAPRPRAA